MNSIDLALIDWKENGGLYIVLINDTSKAASLYSYIKNKLHEEADKYKFRNSCLEILNTSENKFQFAKLSKEFIDKIRGLHCEKITIHCLCDIREFFGEIIEQYFHIKMYNNIKLILE